MGSLQYDNSCDGEGETERRMASLQDTGDVGGAVVKVAAVMTL